MKPRGAGVTVLDGAELAAGILTLLAAPASLAGRGEAGRLAVAANAGTAARYGEMICEQLSNPAFSYGREM